VGHQPGDDTGNDQPWLLLAIQGGYRSTNKAVSTIELDDASQPIKVGHEHRTFAAGVLQE